MADDYRNRGLQLTRRVENAIGDVPNEHLSDTALLALAVVAQTYVFAHALDDNPPPCIAD